MDYPKYIVLNQEDESISIQRVDKLTVEADLLMPILQWTRTFPFFFLQKSNNNGTYPIYMNLNASKPFFWVSDKMRLKPACSVTETS